jgi:hypothetical protein
MAVGVKLDRLQKEEEVAAASNPAFVPWDRFLANSKVPQGQTDEIITWVTKINQKRASLRSGGLRQARDLRKEALLECARRAATTALQARQRERMARWRNLKATLQLAPPPPPSPPQDKSLCDCDACFLCRRHRGSIFDKCYCSSIFSPRPVFMDFTISSVSCSKSASSLTGDLYAGVAESREMDNFLASLGSSSNKRKSEEDSWFLRKRCKA